MGRAQSTNQVRHQHTGRPPPRSASTVQGRALRPGSGLRGAEEAWPHRRRVGGRDFFCRRDCDCPLCSLFEVTRASPCRAAPAPLGLTRVQLPYVQLHSPSFAPVPFDAPPLARQQKARRRTMGSGTAVLRSIDPKVYCSLPSAGESVRISNRGGYLGASEGRPGSNRVIVNNRSQYHDEFRILWYIVLYEYLLSQCGCTCKLLKP